MSELLAVATAMEKESAERYAALEKRMRAAGRLDLAELFERLVGEETAHLETLQSWSRQAIGKPLEDLSPETSPVDVFDDDAMGIVSPELLDAYRSLAVAVRNEERAFAFWSYVAAYGASPDIRRAAERMAREELEHAKTLRRERRKAFLHQRRAEAPAQSGVDLSDLEMEVCALLEEQAGEGDEDEYRSLAREARRISADLASSPLGTIALASPPPRQSLEALCEWLADHYVDAGEILPLQAARDRSQALATSAIKRLAIVRALGGR